MSPRPEKLSSVTVRKPTALGTMFVIISHEGGKLQEAFPVIGKCGSDVYAFGEALGRMISLFLRHECSFSNSQRVAAIVEQLRELGGTRADFQSVPDALADALEEVEDLVK